MTLFSYTARDPLGRLVHGTMDAVSTQTARIEVQAKGLLPEEIHEATMEEKNERVCEPVWEETDAIPAVSFTPSDHGSDLPSQENGPETTWETEPAEVASPPVYFPFSHTLALYAGWLLAYYAVVYAIGWYQHSRELPFEIPYVQALLLSPLVLSFSLAAFLFLLLTTVHHNVGGGKLRGILFGLLGIALFALYQVNVR